MKITALIAEWIVATVLFTALITCLIKVVCRPIEIQMYMVVFTAVVIAPVTLLIAEHYHYYHNYRGKPSKDAVFLEGYRGCKPKS